MHEWALAEGIISTALDYGTKHGAKRIEEVVVVLGELQDIEREIVEFALNQLKEGTIAEGAKFTFQEEKAIFKCRNCGHQWDLKSCDSIEEYREDIHFVPEAVHAFLKCPKCGSRDFEVISGRGVYIKELRVR